MSKVQGKAGHPTGEVRPSAFRGETPAATGSRGRGTPSKYLGVSMSGKRKNTRRMNKLREEFYQEGKRLDADPKTRHLSVCARAGCGQRIDYDAKPGTTPDSHTLEHVKPVDDFPELQEDPTNFAHMHFNCNSSKGKRTMSLGLGEAVPNWW